jgi:hypothetical protein
MNNNHLQLITTHPPHPPPPPPRDSHVSQGLHKHPRGLLLHKVRGRLEPSDAKQARAHTLHKRAWPQTRTQLMQYTSTKNRCMPQEASKQRRVDTQEGGVEPTEEQGSEKAAVVLQFAVPVHNLRVGVVPTQGTTAHMGQGRQKHYIHFLSINQSTRCSGGRRGGGENAWKETRAVPTSFQP